MSNSYTSFKCPSCGADLSIEANRKHLFCTYCGSQLELLNNNEYVIRHINEAEIKHAETERRLELQRLMIEDQQRDIQSRYEKRLSIAIACYFFFLFLMFYVPFKILHNYQLQVFGVMLVLAVVVPFLGPLLKEKATPIRLEDAFDNVDNSSEMAPLPVDINSIKRTKYSDIVSALNNSGFSNVSCIALRDLYFGLSYKPDTVSSIMINGRTVTANGLLYSKTAPIVIYYHSFDR